MAKLTSAANLVRFASVFLGAATVAIGLYAHFSSSWRKYNGEHPYEVCEFFVYLPENLKIACPDLLLEQIFIVLVSICFIASLVGLLLAYAVESKVVKILDMIYHILAATALVAAVVIMYVNTFQIDNVLEKLPQLIADLINYIPPDQGVTLPTDILDLPDDFKTRSAAKFVAGGLAGLNALCYGVIALLIATQ